MMLEHLKNNWRLQGHKLSLYSASKMSFCREENTDQMEKHGSLCCTDGEGEENTCQGWQRCLVT